eukprot:PhF_6_TR43165/c1_g1_i1/m.66108/K10405/KIFC1; kinesin family member C1
MFSRQIGRQPVAPNKRALTEVSLNSQSDPKAKRVAAPTKPVAAPAAPAPRPKKAVIAVKAAPRATVVIDKQRCEDVTAEAYRVKQDLHRAIARRMELEKSEGVIKGHLQAALKVQNDLEEQLQTMTAAKNELQQLLDEERARYLETVQEHNQLGEKHHALEIEMQSKEERIEELQVVLAESEQNTIEMKDTIAEMEAQYNDLMANNVSLSDTIKSLEQMLAAERENVATEKQTVSSLKIEIAELKGTIATERATTEIETEKTKNIMRSMQDEINRQNDVISRMQSNLGQTQGSLSEYAMREKEKEVLLIAGERERRRLLNVIEDLKGNIRVYCRVRPHFGSAPKAQIEFPDKLDHREIEIRQTRDNATSTGTVVKPVTFKYDHVLGPESTQETVFDEVKQMIDSCADGYKVCIFAYGQTGSGKTHTMEGTGSDVGIIPRAMEQLFNTTRQQSQEFEWKYTMTCTFVEIYNENIRDLLADPEEYQKNTTEHEIRHEGKIDTTVTGVTVRQVNAPWEVQELLDSARRNRTTARTKLNDRSSRSHSVFTMKVDGVNAKLQKRNNGVLCLIDLAGSERVAESGVQGQQLKEAIQINKSLSHLGDVIAALGNGEGHVPFRNSKLTYMLQNYLGEGSRTLMFVNVSPSEEHVSETINSLRFAAKVNSTTIGVAKKRVVQM